MVLISIYEPSFSESKNIMSNAGVPVVPGYHGTNQDPNFLLEQAKEIGALSYKTTVRTLTLARLSCAHKGRSWWWREGDAHRVSRV